MTSCIHHRCRQLKCRPFAWAERLQSMCSTSVCDAKTPTVEFRTGELARFADGSATARLGDTVVLATAVAQRSTVAAFSGLPLTVDYRHKAAAAGRIPTNFLRRELGASDREILASRAIDRSIRPLFPHGYCSNTQITCNILSSGRVFDADVLAINATSAALAVSDIPWNGPIAACRVGWVNNRPVLYPTRSQLKDSDLDLIVSVVDGRILMLEGSANNLPRNHLHDAINYAFQNAQNIIEQIQNLQRNFGKSKREIELVAPRCEVVEMAKQMMSDDVIVIYNDKTHDKVSRDVALGVVRCSCKANLIQELTNQSDIDLIDDAIADAVKQIFRLQVLKTGVRCDGRGLTDLRNISCEVGLFKPLHGSALFQRGQSQVLTTVTLDSIEAAFRNDVISTLAGAEQEKRFMLHYEFPPYAINEIGVAGRASAKRRELGHGSLAEKGLRCLIPSDCSFTVRLSSEVLESNGSTSMAAVCGGSLALFDAGVKLREPAAGVAIGLVTRDRDSQETGVPEHRLLTDLLGIEDYMGDMDFKVAGTRTGVTALQMDLKVPGIPLKWIGKALQRAEDGRGRILDLMQACIATPRDHNPNAPLSIDITVPVTKRAKFVGPGGYNVKKLVAETGVQISQSDEITFSLFAPSPEAMQEARLIVENLLKMDTSESNLEFGAVYRAKIVEIRENGAMVILYPEMTPVLISNRQLDGRNLTAKSLNLELNDVISVKYFGRDPTSGKMRLSRKVLSSLGQAGVRLLSNQLPKTIEKNDKAVETEVEVVRRRSAWAAANVIDVGGDHKELLDSNYDPLEIAVNDSSESEVAAEFGIVFEEDDIDHRTMKHDKKL